MSLCNFCDMRLNPDEPHTECDMTPGATCKNKKCAYQWCVHAGPCLD